MREMVSRKPRKGKGQTGGVQGVAQSSLWYRVGAKGKPEVIVGVIVLMPNLPTALSVLRLS